MKSVHGNLKRVSLLAILSLCFSFAGNAQSAGVSAYLLSSTIHYSQYRDNYSPAPPRTIGKTNGFSPGLRLEGNLLTPERRVFHNSAIGISYYFPHRDSSYYFADLKIDSVIGIYGSFKTSSVQANIRSSYNLPFNFEFLKLHVGIGYGLIQYKTQYALPEKNASFNYEQSDFKEYTFVPIKSYGLSYELLAGGMYEFEKFYVMAQYVLVIETANSLEPPARHSLHLGIYYPLKRF